MIMNFMVGIIVDKITEHQRREKEAGNSADRVALQKLASIFFRWDTDGSGKISQEELKEHLADPESRRTLNALDIYIGYDPVLVMTTFDKNEDGSIDLEEFVKGMMHIKNSETTRKIVFAHEQLITCFEAVLNKVDHLRSKTTNTTKAESVQRKVIGAALDAQRQFLISTASTVVGEEVQRQLDRIRKKVLGKPSSRDSSQDLHTGT